METLFYSPSSIGSPVSFDMKRFGSMNLKVITSGSLPIETLSGRSNLN